MVLGAPSLRVCVYNYKGGAAKTTIVVNTSAALAHPMHGNKKVLLMDLDPQCNSTQFFHDDDQGRTLTKQETEPTESSAAAETMLHLLPINGGEPRLSRDELHPRVEAASMDALVSNDGKSPLYKMMRALFVEQDASKIRRMVEQEREGLLHEINADAKEFGGNFWMLEGDPTISEFEPLIAHAFSNAAGAPIAQPAAGGGGPSGLGASTSPNGSKKRKADATPQIDFGPDKQVFEEEVACMKQRYSQLSAWFVYLLGEKRAAAAEG